MEEKEAYSARATEVRDSGPQTVQPSSHTHHTTRVGAFERERNGDSSRSLRVCVCVCVCVCVVCCVCVWCVCCVCVVCVCVCVCVLRGVDTFRFPDMSERHANSAHPSGVAARAIKTINHYEGTVCRIIGARDGSWQSEPPSGIVRGMDGFQKNEKDEKHHEIDGFEKVSKTREPADDRDIMR